MGSLRLPRHLHVIEPFHIPIIQCCGMLEPLRVDGSVVLTLISEQTSAMNEPEFVVSARLALPIQVVGDNHQRLGLFLAQHLPGWRHLQ